MQNGEANEIQKAYLGQIQIHSPWNPVEGKKNWFQRDLSSSIDTRELKVRSLAQTEELWECSILGLFLLKQIKPKFLL